MALMAVMMVLMSVAVPSWRYVVKNMREEELIFRGNQIAEAIERYQKKNGNAAPTSLDVLVEGRFLRKAYTDPMTKDGKWRLIRPGEAVPAVGVPGASPAPAPPPPPGGQGMSLGGILGVASRSKEKSLRRFNGRTQYSEWIFAAGQPRIVGSDAGPRVPAPRLPGASPAPTPSARPGSGPRRQETRLEPPVPGYSLDGGSGLPGRSVG
jgi:type II secretory pathway pseudopilin PulG